MISSKTVNAIEVCVYLAGQQHVGYVTTGELSPNLDLSISYLESILKTLKERGVVCSLKGPGGGYKILGDVSLISIWDIAIIFERTLEAAPHAEGRPTVQHASYESELEAVIKSTLSNFTLADFVTFSPSEAKRLTTEIGRFKFKPLVPAFMPKAPNSVFQLHMSF